MSPQDANHTDQSFKCTYESCLAHNRIMNLSVLHASKQSHCQHSLAYTPELPCQQASRLSPVILMTPPAPMTPPADLITGLLPHIANAFWANTISLCAVLLCPLLAVNCGGWVVEHSKLITAGFPGSRNLVWLAFKPQLGSPGRSIRPVDEFNPLSWFTGGIYWCHTLHLHTVRCNILHCINQHKLQ